MDRGKVIVLEGKSRKRIDKGKDIAIAGPSHSKKERRAPKQQWRPIGSKSQPTRINPRIEATQDDKELEKDRVTMVKMKKSNFILCLDFVDCGVNASRIFAEVGKRDRLFVADPNRDTDDAFPPL
jgi:hypothetical protein